MATILLVEDDPGTLDTFTGILRTHGHTVWRADRGQGGLDVCGHSGPDLVLADLRLPDMSALDMLSELRLTGVSVPFVIVTGFGSVDAALEAGRRGASAFVEKPLFEEDLLTLVKVHIPPIPTQPEPVGRLARVYAANVSDIIEKRYADSTLNIRSTAAEVGLSVPYLCRVLRAEKHDSFYSILRHVRVRAAVRLLRTTSLTQKEIAARVGFNSHGQFDRVFKTICGVSPTAYRSTLRRP